MARDALEIRTAGYKALIDALGMTDAATFITQVASGKGNFTKDRHKYNPKTHEEVVAGIMALQEKMARGEIDFAGLPINKNRELA